MKRIRIAFLVAILIAIAVECNGQTTTIKTLNNGFNDPRATNYTIERYSSGEYYIYESNNGLRQVAPVAIIEEKAKDEYYVYPTENGLRTVTPSQEIDIEEQVKTE